MKKAKSPLTPFSLHSYFLQSFSHTQWEAQSWHICRSSRFSPWLQLEVWHVNEDQSAISLLACYLSTSNPMLSFQSSCEVSLYGIIAGPGCWGIMAIGALFGAIGYCWRMGAGCCGCIMIGCIGICCCCAIMGYCWIIMGDGGAYINICCCMAICCYCCISCVCMRTNSGLLYLSIVCWECACYV